MKSYLSGFLVVYLVAVVSSAYADSHPNTPMITKKSAHSVPVTLDRFTNVLKSKGITIFARINHSGGAEKVGLKLRPTEILLFGNPKLGTPLMQADRKIGVDLPMKVLVWQDDKGDVWLGYLAPSYLKSKYAINNRDKVFNVMTNALGKFTDIATKPGDLPK